MSLVNILLIVGSCYVTVKLYSYSDNFRKLHFSYLLAASVIFLTIQISSGVNNTVDTQIYRQFHTAIADWGQICSLAFILGSLALFIRKSKPVFSQFPKIYSALPILLVFSFFLVKDTYALKNWLLFIYQGGAILIGLLLFGVIAFRNKEYLLLTIGIGVIFISYLLYWSLPISGHTLGWIWKLFLLGGMIVSVLGFKNSILQQVKTE